MEHKTFQFAVDTRTILEIIGIITGFYILYRLQSIIILLFLAMLFAAAINPLVNSLERHDIPRGLSIASVYITIVGLLIFALSAITPPLINQASVMFTRIELPPALKQRFSDYNLQELQMVVQQLTSLPKVINATFSAFSSLVIFLTFGVITYYMLMERPNLHRHLIRFLGRNRDEKEVETFVNNVESQIGGWVRGEALLMTTIGVMTYIGLSLLHVNYALPLAILAGFLEIIPNIGPTISAIPAILIATFTVSLPMGMVVTALYILVQQLENNFIVPGIMRRLVGIHPLITIILMLVGLELWGIIGAVLIIPLYLTVRVAWQEWTHFKYPGEVITGTLNGLKK